MEIALAIAIFVAIAGSFTLFLVGNAIGYQKGIQHGIDLSETIAQLTNYQYSASPSLTSLSSFDGYEDDENETEAEFIEISFNDKDIED